LTPHFKQILMVLAISIRASFSLEEQICQAGQEVEGENRSQQDTCPKPYPPSAFPYPQNISRGIHENGEAKEDEQFRPRKNRF
jgi:hypothetical protein